MMPEGGHSDFGGEYEKNSHRAHISAYVLIAGLVLELVNAVLWFHGAETIASMVAVLLIVGGVWGEVFFANKARIAGDAQLGQYEARAAEANARALEAQLALEKFRKPWTLPVWMLPDFEKLLKPYSGTPYRIMATGDHDASRIAQILKRSFDWAQWSTVPPTGLPQLMDGVELMPDFNGIDIRIDKSRESEWLAAAQAVAEVFKCAEIDVAARVMESGTPPIAVHVLIGRNV